jgi:hypothetical protein
MRFVEYVPDYVLRNYLKIGQEVTILAGSQVHAQVHDESKKVSSYSYTVENDTKVQITNFLPGYTEVYAVRGVFPVHNHQVVWKTQTNLTAYHSTDINNVKEIRDAA